jgi:O-6-methylguanine DNA methyltransferase
MKFKERVYLIVSAIPEGEVMTYKEVAERALRPRAYRAVGNILHANKDPNIPCHRVIRSDGKIGGYNRGAQTKIDLLKREGAKCFRNKTLTAEAERKIPLQGF